MGSISNNKRLRSLLKAALATEIPLKYWTGTITADIIKTFGGNNRSYVKRVGENMKIFVSLLMLLASRNLTGQNLMLNPGAEGTPASTGWTVISAQAPTAAVHWEAPQARIRTGR